jgi:two-component system nitrate/nitrite sensor histidine kinase NarX
MKKARLPTLLRESIRLRLGLAMGMIALLAFLSILTSTVIAENSTGKARAINLSGSLRMLSYRLLADSYAGTSAADMQKTVLLFDQRLRELKETSVINAADYSQLPDAYLQVDHDWQQQIAPLAARVSAVDRSEALPYLAHQIPLFVQKIDYLVQLIETDLENKIHLLRVVQAVLLLLILMIIGVSLYIAKQQVEKPLSALLEAALAVRKGDFSVRVDHQEQDELGMLGLTFNTMVQSLSEMYGQLELRVQEKTQELERTNQTLDLLYRSSRNLAEDDLTQDKLVAVLKDVESALGLGAGLICLRQPDQARAYAIASAMPEHQRSEHCAQITCADCLGDGTGAPIVTTDSAEQPVKMINMQLHDHKNWYGVMPFELPNGVELQSWQKQVLETIAHHVASALASAKRAEERHRLAVLEERSVIARELHDSLAQSLSYLKIQVVRLQGQLQTGSIIESQRILDELKSGLNTAYRELRELLTTFRLQLDGDNLQAALQAAVIEFSGRCKFPVTLDYRLGGLQLTANEDVHVMRIIREALSNIEHHAHATAAEVHLTADSQRRITVLINDNGKGIQSLESPTHHYGLVIMRDRANSLQGDLTIHPRPTGGTQVQLVFSATTIYPLHSSNIVKETYHA